VLSAGWGMGLGLGSASHTLCSCGRRGRVLNLLTGHSLPGQRVFGAREAAAPACLEIVLISTLVFMTGGAPTFWLM